jgi:hypothetical protein
MFKKLFCCHKWNVHNTIEFKRKIEYTNGTNKNIQRIKEVLICTECGKIKIIEY